MLSVRKLDGVWTPPQSHCSFQKTPCHLTHTTQSHAVSGLCLELTHSLAWEELILTWDFWGLLTVGDNWPFMCMGKVLLWSWLKPPHWITGVWSLEKHPPPKSQVSKKGGLVLVISGYSWHPHLAFSFSPFGTPLSRLPDSTASCLSKQSGCSLSPLFCFSPASLWRRGALTVEFKVLYYTLACWGGQVGRGSASSSCSSYLFCK